MKIEKSTMLLVLGECAAVGLIVLGLACPERPVIAKSQRLSEWEMERIIGAGDPPPPPGCTKIEEKDKCGIKPPYNDITGACETANASIRRDKEPGESQEDYDKYCAEHPLPSCDYYHSKWGGGQSFSSAETGGTDGDRPAADGEDGKFKCWAGNKCTGNPTRGKKKSADGKTCEPTSDTSSYCAACSYAGSEDLPNSQQPDKFKCENDPPPSGGEG